MYEAKAFDVMRRHWLLDELDIVVLEEDRHANGFRRSPRGVGVYAQALVWRGLTNDTNYFLVPVGAELDLENGILCGVGNPLAQSVIVGDADCKARQRDVSGVETPHPINRNAEPFPDDVMQGGADCAFRRPVSAERAIELRFDRLERPRVRGAEDWHELLERRDDRAYRFSVIAIRRRLSPTFNPLIVNK